MIFIIDDDDSLRNALVIVFKHEGLAVKAFTSAEDFLASNLENTPSCAIIDMNLPGMNGFELQKLLIQQYSFIPIIFLTGYGEISASVQAIKSGANDYLVKPITHEKLLVTTQSALEKSLQLCKKMDQQQKAQQQLQQLTKREWEVLTLAIDGIADKEIARSLDISYRTVEKHKSNLMQKTGAKKLVDLIKLTTESGLTLDNKPF